MKKIDDRLSYLGKRIDEHDREIESIVNTIRRLALDESVKGEKDWV
jgi:hypothetical protein